MSTPAAIELAPPPPASEPRRHLRVGLIHGRRTAAAAAGAEAPALGPPPLPPRAGGCVHALRAGFFPPCPRDGFVPAPRRLAAPPRHRRDPRSLRPPVRAAPPRLAIAAQT